MSHVLIKNQNTQRIEKWQPWPYLLDLFDVIQTYDVTYILKASQLGVSWLIAIYADWIANFSTTANCLLLSQGQLEAQDLLSKVEFIHSNLPEYLRFPIDKNNREFLSFVGNHSQIRALASTEKAGHGFQGTMVARDELARHPYARENFRAVSRAIDSGGKLIELSTANKEDPTNYFQETTSTFYYDSETVKKSLPSGLDIYTNPKKQGTCLVFLGWKLRPTRYEGMTLEEWYNSRIVPKYTKLELEEQYPEKITDVFKESRVRAFFDVDALEDMGFQLCPPINQTEIDTHNSIVRVYKPPIVGRRYVAYTDPSDGVEDPFVTVVMDFITCEAVASATAKVKIDFVARIHDELVRAYNRAYNSFEYMSTVGGEFSKTIEILGTPNQAPRRKPDGKIEEGKKGQYISKEYKDMMLSQLGTWVTKRQLVSHDREFLQQAKCVTRDDNGKPETDKKLSFDWVMAYGGAVQLVKHVPVEGKFDSWDYRRA